MIVNDPNVKCSLPIADKEDGVKKRSQIQPSTTLEDRQAHWPRTGDLHTFLVAEGVQPVTTLGRFIGSLASAGDPERSE